MIRLIKRIMKTRLFRKRGLIIDKQSELNYSVIINKHEKYPCKVINSKLEITKMGFGCFIENATFYGNISLGDFVSVSGPGVIFHSEVGSISIGSFSSIGENVSVQEFNHKTNTISSSSLLSNVFEESYKNMFVSKGDIVIEEDVWIGSNAVVLSGVRIGRGSVIGAGTIVTKSIPPYSVVVGNPGRVIKKRFSEEEIAKLEESKWWEWPIEKIEENKPLFHKNVGDIFNE